MDKSELQKRRRFLRRSFGNDEIRVTLDPKNTENAAAYLGERQNRDNFCGRRGRRSFIRFRNENSVGGKFLQSYLRKLFENDRLSIVARARKTDSVELKQRRGNSSASSPRMIQNCPVSPFRSPFSISISKKSGPTHRTRRAPGRTHRAKRA